MVRYNNPALTAARAATTEALIGAGFSTLVLAFVILASAPQMSPRWGGASESQLKPVLKSPWFSDYTSHMMTAFKFRYKLQLSPLHHGYWRPSRRSRCWSWWAASRRRTPPAACRARTKNSLNSSWRPWQGGGIENKHSTDAEWITECAPLL